jgi:DNA-binding CsgD family transcriptional regulator
MPGDADAGQFSVTPSEERLLTMLRDGRVDAEIAVRLGISTAEVKERIERLAAKLGASDRPALRGWALNEPAGPEQRPIPRSAAAHKVPQWWAVAALALGLAVGATAAAFSRPGPWIGSDPDDNGSAGPNQEVTPTVQFVIVEGRSMIDAGQLFRQLGRTVAVASVEARGRFTLVTLTGPSSVLLEGGLVVWHLNDNGTPTYNASFSGTLESQPVTLHILAAGNETRLLPGDPNSLGIYTRGDKPPSILVWVDDRSAAIGADGHLHVDRKPTPESAVVAYDTGEILDASRATPLAKVSGAWTLCGSGEPACIVETRPLLGPEFVVADGQLVCRPDGILELSTDLFRLEFDRLGAGGSQTPDCEPFSTTPVEVKSGQVLSNWPYQYRIRAVGPSGPLSVVVAGDGTLLVGEIRPRFGCPCRGN